MNTYTRYVQKEISMRNVGVVMEIYAFISASFIQSPSLYIRLLYAFASFIHSPPLYIRLLYTFACLTNDALPDTYNNANLSSIDRKPSTYTVYYIYRFGFVNIYKRFIHARPSISQSCIRQLEPT